MRRVADGTTVSVTSVGASIVVNKYLDDGGLVATETLCRGEVRARIAVPVVARRAWWIGRGITIDPADVEWFADELRMALDQ